MGTTSEPSRQRIFAERSVKSNIVKLIILALSSVATLGADISNRLQIIPVANACKVAKHPVLPVLYVGCQDSAESKNLVTFQLKNSVPSPGRCWPYHASASKVSARASGRTMRR